MNNLYNTIRKECCLIERNGSDFRDAKMRYYLELRTKSQNDNIINFCNRVLDYIYKLKYAEILTKN